MHPANLANETERHRCHDTRDGLRCQLMTRQRPAHAALTAKGTRARRDGERSWLEVEDYRFRSSWTSCRGRPATRAKKDADRPKKGSGYQRGGVGSRTKNRSSGQCGVITSLGAELSRPKPL
jgi:hypothetical protein